MWVIPRAYPYSGPRLYAADKKAGVFVLGKNFQPSLMFVVKKLVSTNFAPLMKASMALFTTLHFLRNRPNKLDCRIHIGCKGLPRTNTLANGAYL